MKHIKWIWDFWRPHRPWIYVLLFLTLLSSAVTIGFPLVFKYLIDVLTTALDDASPDRASETTWMLVKMIAVIGLARSIVNLYPGTRAMLNAKLEMDIRTHYFSAIIEKGHKFFRKFRTGDLVTRLMDDIGAFPKIAWFSCSGVFRAIESSSKFIFCIAIMLYMNWQLALISIAPLPLMLYIFYRVRSALSKRSKEQQEIISRTNEMLEAAFSGIRIIKAFSGEMNQARAFRKILGERIGVELNVTKLWMGIMNLFWAIEFVGQIIVIAAGGIMVINGSLTLGEFYAFYIYLSLFLHPMMDIPHLFVTSRQAFACIDREIEIEETPGGTEGAYEGTRRLGKIEKIEIKGASFSYNGDVSPALADVSLEIGRGERVAVVGTVGSGKSTLLKVAAAILPTSDGEVLVNGTPLGELDISEFRALSGYIPQESTLFSETVEDNVRFGREASREEVTETLRMAQVLGEVEEMPRGVEEMLGQKGLKVSGGQKQRLAIARALVSKPDFLLMDDCTASLDAENERDFWESFSREYPDTACLIVTHRLATAREADVIYVLSDGQVVGRGTHDELLKSCDEYRNFLTRQELKAAIGSLAGSRE